MGCGASHSSVVPPPSSAVSAVHRGVAADLHTQAQGVPTVKGTRADLEREIEKNLKRATQHVKVLRVAILSSKNLSLPLLSSSASLRITVNEQQRITQQLPVKNGTIHWNTRMKFIFDHEPTAPMLIELLSHGVSGSEVVGRCLVNVASQEKSPWYWIDIQKFNNNNNGPIQVIGKIQLYYHGSTEMSAHDNDFLNFTYSHLLVVKVKSARNLSGPYVDKKLYVEAHWGLKHYRTDSRLREPNSQEWAWNTETGFWIDREHQSSYQLFLNVNADLGNVSKQHNHEDDVAQCFLNSSKIFELAAQTDERELKELENVDENKKVLGLDLWIPLQAATRLTDKDLNNNASNVVQMGELHVQLFIIPKTTLQRKFLEFALQEFDLGHGGTLTPHDVHCLLTLMGIHFSNEQFSNYFAHADTDRSGTLSGDELLSLLHASEQLDANTSASLHAYLIHVANYHLSGGKALDRSNPLKDLMMSGATQPIVKNEGEITIKDRATGLLVTESIPKYIKVALQSMYSTQGARMLSTSGSSIALMQKLSIKQGRKYDDPKSVEEIPHFVALHNLNIDDIEKPISEYKTFNEFFARKLKESARPIAAIDNPEIAVCPADCRMMIFPKLMDCTKMWVKGDEFTVEGLLGSRADLADRYLNGSLVINRLAPQDYHRWHLPVCGKLLSCTPIDGALFTVNPLAINQNVNVYTQNKREIFEMETDHFGRMLIIPIGATMVGTITTKLPLGVHFKKGSTHGYFTFGGSTVLLLFEEHRIIFDENIMENSRRNIETLVRVNTSLGRAIKP